jgi:hypothetical protein
LGYTRYLLLIALLVCSHVVFAQGVTNQLGSRSLGMGNATSSFSDSWGVFNNIASIAEIETSLISSTHELRPTLPGANRVGVLGVTKIKTGSLGFGASKFGDQLYSEQNITAGFSNKLGIAALGARVNYVQYRAEGFNSRNVVMIDVGGIAQLTPQIAIGAFITNLNQAKISQETDEIFPSKMIVGIGFQPSTNFRMSTELEKDLEYNATFKAGLEYLALKKIAFRSGFNLKPNAAFFGLGFRTNKFQIDYALQYNVIIAAMHEATVTYLFKKS